MIMELRKSWHFGELSGQSGPVKRGSHLYLFLPLACPVKMSLECESPESPPEQSSQYVQMGSFEVPKQNMSLLRKIFCDGMISLKPFRTDISLWFYESVLRLCGVSGKVTSSQLIFTAFEDDDQLKLSIIT